MICRAGREKTYIPESTREEGSTLPPQTIHNNSSPAPFPTNKSPPFAVVSKVHHRRHCLHQAFSKRFFSSALGSVFVLSSFSFSLPGSVPNIFSAIEKHNGGMVSIKGEN